MGRHEAEAAAVLFNNWTMALYQSGRPLEAEAVCRRSIELKRADQTEEAVSPMVLDNYANMLRELNRFDETASYADRAYAAAQKLGYKPSSRNRWSSA